MAAEAFPRVLFLTSAAFNRVTGGGLTFSNLFAGWPKDSIATVHNDAVPVTTDVCDRYFRLGERELRRWGPLRYLPAGQAVAGGTGGKVGPAPKRPSLMFVLMRHAKRLVLGDGMPETVEISTALDTWIREYRPQVLYTILGSNAMMDLAMRLGDRYELPIVVHIMDDWVSVLYRGGVFSFLQRMRKERLMRRVVREAAVRMAICDDMASAYESRYGYPFVAFQNTIEVARWDCMAKVDLVPKRPVRVAYIGSILPFAQLDSLVDCCKAIQLMSRDGIAIRLDIYSPAFLAEQYRDRLVVGGAVALHETLSDDLEFFGTLRDADVLLLPVNFDAYTVEYIRYSMPTKVPAYLSIGTPILAYGPAEVAQIAYARRAGWALAVTERGVEHVRRGLEKLVDDIPLRQQLSAQARQTARERHDASTVRRDFQACLCNIASPGSNEVLQG